MGDAAPYRVDDLAAMDGPPAAGILSRTVHSGDTDKVVWFGFAPGEELSEHTSSRPAIIHVLSVEIDLRLAGDDVAAGPGTLVHMAPGLPHALRARGPATMLLTLLPAPGR